MKHEDTRFSFHLMITFVSLLAESSTPKTEEAEVSEMRDQQQVIIGSVLGAVAFIVVAGIVIVYR